MLSGHQTRIDGHTTRDDLVVVKALEEIRAANLRHEQPPTLSPVCGHESIEDDVASHQAFGLRGTECAAPIVQQKRGDALARKELFER